MYSFINDDVFLKNGFLISIDQSLLDFKLIYNYLNTESYWAKGIPKDKLHRAIENSICFGVYHHKNQVGLARVISDKATFAYICDVFIIESYRRRGLSKWLVQSIINYPDLQGLRRWSLATADAHGLYSQFGFKKISIPERWMEIIDPYLKTLNEEEKTS